MKFFQSLIIIFILSLSTLSAQNKEVKTIKFEVNGVCGMCEERIENALDVSGVKAASWDRSTHMCEVTYRTDKISEDEIHKLLNEAGHDTEKSKATDEQYATVHKCCKYREDHDH